VRVLHLPLVVSVEPGGVFASSRYLVPLKLALVLPHPSASARGCSGSSGGKSDRVLLVNRRVTPPRQLLHRPIDQRCRV
jgi:hypothetical protein